MYRRTARGNRLGLALTGLLLLLAGAALIGANRGVYGAAGPDNVLYTSGMHRFVSDNRGWLWPVAAAVAIIVGLVFLRWLLLQTRADDLRSLRVDSEAAEPGSEDTGGRTVLRASALTDAVEEDLGSVRGVRRARARLSGHPDHPQLWLEVTTDSDADFARIRGHIANTTVADARTCLELPEMDTYLRLDVSRHTNSRR